MKIQKQIPMEIDIEKWLIKNFIKIRKKAQNNRPPIELSDDTVARIF